MEIMNKKCSKCGEIKISNEFNKSSKEKSGLRVECRECQKKKAAEYRASESGRNKRSEWKRSEVAKEYDHKYATTDEYREKRRLRADRERFGGNRKIVLERDNYSCVICGSSEKLQVHHKDEMGRNKPINEMNNDVNNLITICASCHIKQHNPVLKRWAKRGDA